MTTFFQRGPAEEMPRFELNLDGVTISRRCIDSAIWCVQGFVRNPLFTQWDFITDNRISMLLSAVSIAGSVCEDSVYDPWKIILPDGYGDVVNDLKKAYDYVVVRRKDSWDTSERWFGVAGVESCVVGESSDQQANRISNIVVVGEVEYLPHSIPTPQMHSTSSSVKLPGKGKREKGETPAPVAIKRRFEFDDESNMLPKGRGVSFDDPSFAIALKYQDTTVSSRRSGLSCRAEPVFQSSPR